MNAWSDKKKRNPLMLAAENGHDHCMVLLFQAGVDVNAKNISKTTALMLAARHGHRKCLAGLIDTGASASQRDIIGPNGSILRSREWTFTLC